MAPHFGTYHWSKKNFQGCQNTVQGYKIAFDTLFLATCIGVALKLAHHSGHMGPGDAEFEGEKVNYFPPTPADDSSSDMELSICPTINDGFLNLKK